MNIAFFLLPKSEVITTTLQATLRQTLERMEYHRYTAVPILSDDGLYVGTVTEGDLLWFLKNSDGIGFEHAHRHILAEVPLRVQNNRFIFMPIWSILSIWPKYKTSFRL